MNAARQKFDELNELYLRSLDRTQIAAATSKILSKTVTGHAAVPLKLLSPMVVLDDPGRPSSAHVFDPEHPENTLGTGARFVGAEISVTADPVSHGIATLLPWLVDRTTPLWLSDYNDAFRQENHGFPLFKSNFY